VAPALAPASDRSGPLAGLAVPQTVPPTGPQQAGIAAAEAALGVHVELVHLFRPYPEPLLPPDAATIAATHTMVLSWNGGDLAAVASGAEDSWIREQARAVAASGLPVYLRLRWEMNRPNLRTRIAPATYVAAWRRAHALFDEAGAINVRWVWCPLANGFDAAQASAYYPGDDEVDWLCADAYATDALTPLAQLMAPVLAWARGHHKPMMIAEYGVPRSVPDVDRASWLRAAGAWLTGQHEIRAALYFDIDADPATPDLQFGLDAGSQAAAAFAAMGTTGTGASG